MEGYSPNQLLEREWVFKTEEKKLELRLGPPGVERDWKTCFEVGVKKNNNKSAGNNHSHHHENLLSLGQNNSWMNTTKNGPYVAVVGKESSQHCSSSMGGAADLQKNADKMKANNTAVPNTSQKRSAPPPVVGWPPIRSFRKNLASSSSAKQAPEESNKVDLNKAAPEKPVQSCPKGLFVKINMDGVPIGRKVDLKAYDSYEKLSSAVDELFRGLLAAQSDSSATGFRREEKAITGLLDGSGEYTLVYEDNEGDRMLVGDVPWHMFVSTVKRLRVLKSSELSSLRLGSKQEKIST